MNLSPVTLIICNLVIFLAFYIRSLTGFGGALISIPLLALLFDLKLVVPLESLLEIGISIPLVKSVSRKIDKGVLFPLVSGAFLGTILGSYFLKTFANITLKRLLGAAIILFSLNLLHQLDRDKQPPSRRWGYLAGLVGGVLGGMFGTSGPPFVIYLTYQLKKKGVLRATLIGLFALDFSWRVVIFAINGLLTLEIIKFALSLTPALMAGTLLGHYTHFRVGEERFRQIVALILGLSGVVLLVR